MYLPPQFRCEDPRIAARLMREHPLATLMSVDDEGLPFVTHLPLHLEAPGQADAEPSFTLLGHVAKPNPHARYLRARPRARVSFLGPHAYLSPKVYPDLQRVPSWNYLAVTCVVEAQFLDAHAPKDQLLKALIGDHEPAYAEQWRGLPADYTDKMLAGIVAFALRVVSWQCKLKINQHRPESHAALHVAYAAGNEQEQAMARWMKTLGMVPKDA
jgi:transcriptional regulator